MNHPPRILVVDDNYVSRDIIATRLAAMGTRLCKPPTVKKHWQQSDAMPPI